VNHEEREEREEKVKNRSKGAGVKEKQLKTSCTSRTSW